MFTSIVAAVDGSDPSEHALSVACKLAKQFDADLHLIHSPQIETMAIAVGSGAVEIPVSAERIAEAGHKVIDACAETVTAQGCKLASQTVGTGDAVDNILTTAELNDADLIVLGRRGLGSVASLFLGSVSQKVSHGAKCSVMTVA